MVDAQIISVIVTTYNREDALEVVLRALARQSDRNFEVVVADDGSTPATPIAAARRAAQTAPVGLARRALMQSRGLAPRPRPGRRVRRKLQRVGPRGFRSADPAPARGHAPQGRQLRDRRATPVACGT